MDKIKQAIADGKVIKCATPEEKQKVCEVMGWEYYPLCDESLFIQANRHQKSDYETWKNAPDGFTVVPFASLTRSNLAAALGVDDDEPFMWRGQKYRIHNNRREYEYERNVWRTCAAEEDLDCMIADPGEIEQCPRWSEETIKAARAAELLIGDGYILVDGGGNQYLALDEDDSVAHMLVSDWIRLIAKPFDGVKPGQTVKLSEIK